MENGAKYIFLDIDGTLLDPGTHTVPDSAIKAINLAKENGHKLFISTGRSFSETEEIKRMDLSFDGYIYSSGSIIEVDNSKIYEQFMSTDDITYLSKLASKSKLGYVLEGYQKVFLDKFAYDFFIEIFFRDEKDSPEIIKEKMDERGFLSIEKYDAQHDKICKVSVYGKGYDTFEDLKKCLGDNYKMVEVPGYTDAGIVWYEITAGNVSKATGVEIILNNIGARRSDSISFGDSLNDYEMLQYTHLGICMGNGNEELKKTADDVTLPVDEDGLYFGFKKHGLI